MLFNTLDNLIKTLETMNIKKASKEIFILNGNELDVIELIKRYNLSRNTELVYDNQKHISYALFKYCCNDQVNTFAVGPKSMYGHMITKININNIQVEVRQNPKSNYESKYSSKILKEYNNQNFVVLDIETTGLDPVVDDIIQICIFESNQNKYVKYLPLIKKELNTAKDFNNISESTLKNKKPLSQNDIDNIIQRFNLKEKIIMIWTGKNLFDRVFLEVYFKENNLKGLENFTFFNAKTLLDNLKDIIMTKDLSKDNIARLYEMDLSNSHDALADCEIEKDIICNLLNNYIEPLQINYEKNLLLEVFGFFNNLILKIKNCILQKCDIWDEINWEGICAKKIYLNFCDMLQLKYGKLLQNYDEPHRTRGSEWLDIHHIDEIEIDNIAVRTQNAIKNKDDKELLCLHKFNNRERLVYANKIEHFILHALLDIIRAAPSGGLHFTFGEVVKLEICKCDKGSSLYKLQKQKNTFYNHFSFDSIMSIYITMCKFWSINNIENYIKEFWKINSYDYDKITYTKIMDIINNSINE